MTTEICNLAIQARDEMVPPAVGFVSQVAATAGLDAADCGRLEVAVEEACTNVIEHAYAASDEGTIRLVVERWPGKIAVSIHDQGLPADLSALEQGGLGIGSKLMHAFADEVHFQNLGHGGKCVKLIKNLPCPHVDSYPAEAPRAEETGGEVSLRWMRADESIALARCIYFAYGYSYGSEFVYYPERTREMIESGLLASCVAVTERDEIVGHTALMFEHPDDPVAESGVAAVTPAWRGHHLFERMKKFVLDAARDGVPRPGGEPRRLLGVYSEAATVHPFTQNVNIALGCCETGVLLAFAPSSMQFKVIEDGTRTVRQSIVLYHARTNPEPPRDLYPPRPHRQVIEKICMRAGIQRRLRDAPRGAHRVPAQVDVVARPDWGQAYVVVRSHGTHLVEQVKLQLSSLCRQKIECILLDLPLCDPETAHAVAHLEALGFFFGGVLFENRDGDVLRMQYLNNVVPDLDAMHVVSDFGRELRDYAVGCMRG